MSASYLIYTKPACPHCVRAKTALSSRGVEFKTQDMDTDEKRAKLLGKLNGWRTFPAILHLGPDGKPDRFVGGADNLLAELGAP